MHQWLHTRTVDRLERAEDKITELEQLISKKSFGHKLIEARRHNSNLRELLKRCLPNMKVLANMGNYQYDTYHSGLYEDMKEALGGRDKPWWELAPEYANLGESEETD